MKSLLTNVLINTPPLPFDHRHALHQKPETPNQKPAVSLYYWSFWRVTFFALVTA
jgi:hypothetical protein